MTKQKKRIFARQVAKLKSVELQELANVAGGRQCLSCCGDDCRFQPDDSDDI